MIYIYTDGSAKNNGKRSARAGVGVWFGPDDSRNISEPLVGPEQTNNRAELTAILRALEAMSNRRNEPITIVSDSQYSIRCVSVWIHAWKKNHWKTSKKQDVKNKDLIVRIDDLMSRFTHLQYRYVKAHTNKDDQHSVGNRWADQLAEEGAQQL